MANRYCKIISPYSDYDIVKINVGDDTLYPGDVVKVETLDTSLSNNFSVYSPTPCDTLAGDELTIILNQDFERLSDGRMPQGNSDFSTYSFTTGQCIYGMRLRKNYVFHISYDAVDNTSIVVPAVSVKLIPQLADFQLKTSATYTTETTVLNVEYLKTIPAGNVNGSTFINGMIARVVEGY